MSVGLLFFFGEDLFQMDLAIGLVIIDTQYILAAHILASSSFGEGFQCFFHGYSFRRDFLRTGTWQSANSEPSGPDIS